MKGCTQLVRKLHVRRAARRADGLFRAMLASSVKSGCDFRVPAFHGLDHEPGVECLRPRNRRSLYPAYIRSDNGPEFVVPSARRIWRWFQAGSEGCYGISWDLMGCEPPPQLREGPGERRVKRSYPSLCDPIRSEGYNVPAPPEHGGRPTRLEGGPSHRPSGTFGKNRGHAMMNTMTYKGYSVRISMC